MMKRPQWDSVLLSPNVEERLEDVRTEIALVFPEVDALVGFGGGDTGHKDLWGHTKQVVSQCIQSKTIRWAALFHDVGKVKCFTKVDGKIAFIGHEHVSARLFANAVKRVNFIIPFFTAEEAKDIKFLIYNLGYVEEYDSTWTDSAVRRVHRLAGPYFNDLVALARADISSKNEAKRKKHFETMKELRDRAHELAERDATPQPLVTGLGEALTAAFNIPPSKALGDLMKKLKEAVEAGSLPVQSSVETVITFVNEHKDEYL